MSCKKISSISMIVLLTCVLAGALFIGGCGSKTEKPAVSEGKQSVETQTAPGEDKAETKPQQAESTRPSGTQATEPQVSKTDETDTVTRIAIESAQANNSGMSELRVVDVKVVEGWARVVLEPVDQSADAAMWLLKKVNGAWTVVDFGTALMPEDYPGAPPELFR